jgi:glyoxylase-like metal-dependent hydrolase (beta-lactamase superfamily II)
MNELEHRLQYPHGERIPAPGHTLEVAPGVRWVRMGLPFALDHINLWLLRDEQDGRAGWTVVDCGITDDATRAAWERVFEHELDGLPVLRVIVTHMHPDHIGLAHWLTERWQCRLWISATDFNAARVGSQTTTGYGGESAASFFASHGLTDPDSVAKVRARSNYYASMVPRVPAQYRRLMDGDVLDIGGRAWRCISGYGHAPEHISLYCDELHVLLSGDMVLPRISTNVSVSDMEPNADPLKLYLDSLDKYAFMPDDALILPSHGRPFKGVHVRIAQQRDHHAERLDEVMQACAESPQSASDIVPIMFKRKLDLHQLTFALGEALAHLHTLYFRGELRRYTDDDGVIRFTLAGASTS